MLRDELRELLRDFAATTGATSAAVVRPEEGEESDRPGEAVTGEEPAATDDEDVREIPVGGGAVLCARFPAPPTPGDDDRSAALERTARALRACARRWDVAILPAVAYPETRPTDRERVLARIHAFLEAFANHQNVKNAVVTRGGTRVASSTPLGELEAERIPFIVRQVGAEAARRVKSSHAEVGGDDFFAASFYIDAHLIAFFDGPVALDFVRHRARLVIRELSHLLALLDDPPGDPAISAPIPE